MLLFPGMSRLSQFYDMHISYVYQIYIWYMYISLYNMHVPYAYHIYMIYVYHIYTYTHTGLTLGWQLAHCPESWVLSLLSRPPWWGNWSVPLCKGKDWVFTVGPSLQSPVWSQLCFTSGILSLAPTCHVLLSANPNQEHLHFCACGKTI